MIRPTSHNLNEATLEKKGKFGIASNPATVSQQSATHPSRQNANNNRINQQITQTPQSNNFNKINNF